MEGPIIGAFCFCLEQYLNQHCNPVCVYCIHACVTAVALFVGASLSTHNRHGAQKTEGPSVSNCSPLSMQSRCI